MKWFSGKLESSSPEEKAFKSLIYQGLIGEPRDFGYVPRSSDDRVAAICDQTTLYGAVSSSDLRRSASYNVRVVKGLSVRVGGHTSTTHSDSFGPLEYGRMLFCHSGLVFQGDSSYQRWDIEDIEGYELRSSVLTWFTADGVSGVDVGQGNESNFSELMQALLLRSRNFVLFRYRFEELLEQYITNYVFGDSEEDLQKVFDTFHPFAANNEDEGLEDEGLLAFTEAEYQHLRCLFTENRVTEEVFEAYSQAFDASELFDAQGTLEFNEIEYEGMKSLFMSDEITTEFFSQYRNTYKLRNAALLSMGRQ